MGPFSSKVVSSKGVVSVNQSQIDPNEGNLPEKLASQIEVFVKDENGNLYRLNSYEVAKFNIYKIDHGEDGDSAWLLSRREHRHSKLLKTDYEGYFSVDADGNFVKKTYSPDGCVEEVLTTAEEINSHKKKLH